MWDAKKSSHSLCPFLHNRASRLHTWWDLTIFPQDLPGGETPLGPAVLRGKGRIQEKTLQEDSKRFWSRRSDLNGQPADYDSAALPLSYTGSKNIVAKHFPAVKASPRRPRIRCSCTEGLAVGRRFALYNPKPGETSDCHVLRGTQTLPVEKGILQRAGCPFFKPVSQDYGEGVEA